MTYRIETTNGIHAIFTPSGNAARTTSGEAFQTTDLARAEEALAYLNAQEARRGLEKTPGSQWVKSTFGTI